MFPLYYKNIDYNGLNKYESIYYFKSIKSRKDQTNGIQIIDIAETDGQQVQIRLSPTLSFGPQAVFNHQQAHAFTLIQAKEKLKYNFAGWH
jgi:hypothetical protein